MTEQDANSTTTENEEFARFLVAREQHQLRECVHDATHRAEALLVDADVKRLANEHFETQRAKRGTASGPYAEPLVIASTLSVLRATDAKPLVLHEDKPAERVRAPAGAWQTAHEAAKHGADVFVIVVEALERTAHQLVARCVVAAQLVHARPPDAKLPKQFAKRIKQLCEWTYLSPVRVHTVVRDLGAETECVRTGSHVRTTNARADATEAEKKAALDALGAAARHQKERHAHLDGELRKFIDFTQRVQSFEVQRRFDTLLSEVLTQTDLREQLQQRVDDAACDTPLIVLARTRNGCLAYGAASIKFADPAKWIASKEPNKFEAAVLADAEAHRGAADGVVLVATDEAYGVLFGYSTESFRYYGGVLARATPDADLRNAVRRDLDDLERAQADLEAAFAAPSVAQDDEAAPAASESAEQKEEDGRGALNDLNDGLADLDAFCREQDERAATASPEAGANEKEPEK